MRVVAARDRGLEPGLLPNDFLGNGCPIPKTLSPEPETLNPKP